MKSKPKKTMISFRLPLEDPAEMERLERETGAVRIPLDLDVETLRAVRLQVLTKLADRNRPLTFGEMEDLFDLVFEVAPDGSLRLRPDAEWPFRPFGRRTGHAQ